MKILLDLLPVIFFFVSYKVAGGQAAEVQAWLNPLLGGGVTVEQAPILLATAVTILASMVQVTVLLISRKRVDGMLWLSLGIVTVFGGATLFFHNATFIKWKPTVLYWTFASALAIGRFFFGRNFIQEMLNKQMSLPPLVWLKLNTLWTFFFIAMGGINLFVAYQFSEATWVNFKLFGLTALMFVFVLGQGLFLARFMHDEDKV